MRLKSTESLSQIIYALLQLRLTPSGILLALRHDGALLIRAGYSRRQPYGSSWTVTQYTFKRNAFNNLSTMHRMSHIERLQSLNLTNGTLFAVDVGGTVWQCVDAENDLAHDEVPWFAVSAMCCLSVRQSIM